MIVISFRLLPGIVCWLWALRSPLIRLERSARR
jgi:hypothetical protein